MEREFLEKLGVDGLWITGSANMTYQSGFLGEGAVYVSATQKVVVTDFRYVLSAKKEAPDYEIVTWRNSRGDTLRSLAEKDGFRQGGDSFRIGIEEDFMTVGQKEQLEQRFPEARFVGVSKELNQLRSVKTSKEIEQIRRAEHVGDQTFLKVLEVLKEQKDTITEREVAAYIEYTYKTLGASGPSFDTIAASGEHSAMPHAMPTNDPLVPNHFLTMDFGCKVNGYCSDMTRTVAIGEIDEEKKRIYQTVLEAQEAAIAAIRPGMKGREVDQVARDIIAQAGYGTYFGHALGHSVGLEIHEGPNFSPKEEAVILPGMTITVEPGIYIEGVGGVRIEDLIVVTEDGCENLTQSEKKLIVI